MVILGQAHDLVELFVLHSFGVALFNGMLKAIFSFTPFATPFILLEKSPADDQGILLHIGILVGIHLLVAIVPSGEPILRTDSLSIHLIVDPAKPVPILVLAGILVLAIITMD